MTIHMIPLSKLIPSAANVRKTGATLGIADLAASIKAHGLLQNLQVRPAEGGKFEVVAGRRRLAALKRLAKNKEIEKLVEISCHVLSDEDDAEISLAENLMRLPMHPADQFEAFYALAEGGKGPEEIAARFGCSPATVRQRLKLAGVSPRLIKIYRAGKMDLDQLMAFAISDDHAAQEAAWFAEHRSLTTYARLRAEGRRLFPPAQAIRSIKLYHRQVYKFEYHRPKLAMLRQGREHARLAGVADFLERVPKDCPHELFRGSERASQKAADFIDASRLIVIEKENFATRMAALVIPTIGNNRLRHEALQRFMLVNDSTTLAVEVPIWLPPSEILALEREHGILLRSPGAAPDASITGHIDFLQVRNGAVHILDYKPDARTNRPIAQLTIYALALTRLVPGLKLFDIKCAWFNQEEYLEFFPRALLARHKD